MSDGLHSSALASEPSAEPRPPTVRGGVDAWVDHARGLGRLLARTIAAALHGKRPTGEVVRHMYWIGNKSLLFVGVTLGALGMVLVFQACLQVNRITGDLSQVGAEYIKGLVHEFVPSIMAQMLATRVGAGIAAEIGSMMVTEQVDAMRMCGVEPVHYLIAPRFIASFWMTMVLYVFAMLVCIVTGTLTAYYSFHVNPHVFVDFGRVRLGDVATGLIKCAAYGAAIPVVSGYCGLIARGGSEGVGRATTRAVIGAAFTCTVLDFVLSGLAYFTLQAGDTGPPGG
jgi:phospholipid/cholesterol/gamma-HCH transport system permease protein